MSLGIPDLDFVALISNLRLELEDIENSLKSRDAYCNKRQDNHSRITNKFEELSHIQQNVITLNIEGKIISMACNFILKSKYRTILEDAIGTGETFFIDRNRKHIKILINIIRGSSHGKTSFVLPDNLNFQVFKEDFLYFFKYDVEQVLTDLKITFEQADLRKQFKSYLKNFGFKIINHELTMEYMDNNINDFKAFHVDEIKDIYGIKAFFIEFEGNIVFELNDESTITTIEMRPFYGNIDFWFPGDGVGATISCSIDKINWSHLGKIPDDYGMDVDLNTLISVPETSLRYIKFQPSQYPLSISYLKLS